MSTSRVVGQRIPRVDSLARVTGDLRYGVDVSLPGMLHGAVLRSTEAHAEIAAISTGRASALPGVHVVLTAGNLPDVRLPDYIHDTPLLARDRVRYAGEAVALVAAENPWIAAEALSLIEVEYRPLQPIWSVEDALGEEAPLIHPEWATYRAARGLERSGNMACRVSLERGDVRQAFSRAAHVVEERFTTSSVHQMHIEPHAAIAVAEPGGRMTVYCNTQLPFWTRTSIAAALGVPESQVRVIVTGIGGAFGAKCQPVIEHLCALLAHHTARPVRMTTTVAEQMVAGHPRHPATIEIRTALAADGLITGREARVLLDAGAYAGPSPSLASLALMVLGGVYRVQNLSLEARAIYTNKLGFGAFRAPGGPQSNFALESHMDTIAAELGMDPLELRLKNLIEEGDVGPSGQRLQGVGLQECIERASQAIEWSKPAGPNRGKGLACGWWITLGGPSGCYAKLESDGRLMVHLGAPEMGTGAVTQGTRLLLAEALGIEVEDVLVISGDTDSTPFDAGSAGSRTLFNLGNAALSAVEEIKEQLRDLAADLLEVDPHDLEFEDGRVRVKGSPEHGVSLAELARKGLYRSGGILGRGVYQQPTMPYDRATTHSFLHPTFDSPSFHCHATEVEVDPVTGEVRILRYVAAHDVGRAINPMGVEGQIEGGVAQGIGMALMEELVIKDGVVLNPSLADYKIPTIADVPPIETIIVEHPGVDGPFGAKGVGESPILEPPAALANAIFQATGARIRDLPITPEKILRALASEEGDHPI